MEEEVLHDSPPHFNPYEEDSPILSPNHSPPIDVKGPIDAPSSRTRSKVPSSDVKFVNQVYEEFSDLYASEMFGPE
eukprot:8775976-Ditylum_brightwellii.AAC.1